MLSMLKLCFIFNILLLVVTPDRFLLIVFIDRIVSAEKSLPNVLFKSASFC